MLVTGNLGPSLAHSLALFQPLISASVHIISRGMSLISCPLFSWLLTCWASRHLQSSSYPAPFPRVLVLLSNQHTLVIRRHRHLHIHKARFSIKYLSGVTSPCPLRPAQIGVRQKVWVWSNERENEAVTWPPRWAVQASSLRQPFDLLAVGCVHLY